MIQQFSRAALLIFSLLAISSCMHNAKKTEVRTDILKANLDTTVNPATDFFHYAVGGWLKNNPIPNDESNWGISQLVQEEIYKRLRNINEEAVKKQAKQGTEQQIGDFWYSGMDSAAIEKNGLQSLHDELNKIAAIKTPGDVMTETVRLHNLGLQPLFTGFVLQDAKNSDVMAYMLWQGGLGLPERDYYFNTDVNTSKVRNEYPHYIARIFMLTGVDSVKAAEKAQSIFALETKLAKASRKLEALRDPYANYHKAAIKDLGKLSPGIDWPVYIKQLGVAHVDSVILGQPEFYKALGEVINHEKLETLKDYLSFHLLNSLASSLNHDFVQTNFDFYGKLLEGARQLRPRWKRILDDEENAMGEAVGQLFAKEYFNDTAKKRYNDMVEGIRNAYKARIEKLDWMSDSTKQKALLKLAAIRKKVGYPDKWKDFSRMKINRGPYVLNMLSARQWWVQFRLNKLGRPVDREEWDISPQTYNAYYEPANNEIVLPAGIFTVPGYRDEELDDALVYGYAAASTIGHEITHGFDDEGRQYDEKGNLRNWWSKADEQQFNQRAAILAKQFSAMVVVDTLHIKGKVTLGENLADLGGLLLGVDAFQQTEAYKKNAKINGLTPMQRFFLGYALGWMYNIRPEQLASKLMSDVHAPAQYRVNGPMPNVPAFYEAFNVKPGDAMYLPDSARVRLW